MTSTENKEPQPVKVSGKINLGETDLGCLGLIILVSLMILGSSVESAGDKVARAIDRYTDRVVAVQPARTTP